MSSADDFLIDDEGDILPVASLAHRFGPGRTDDALIQHVVCDLGYIRIVARADGMMVELRAGAFSLITLIDALFSITDRRPTRILLTIYGDDGHKTQENFTSIGAFANRTEFLAQSPSDIASSGCG